MRRVIRSTMPVGRDSPLSASIHKLGSCYFALIVDACLLLFVSQWASAGWSEVGLLLDGLLLFTAAVATASGTPILLLPNLAARALFLTILLFFSCFAMDALLRPDDSLQILPAGRRKIAENPQIAIISSIFCILFVIEFKLFVRVWQILQKNNELGNGQEKPPPPYSICFEDDPPKYEEVACSSRKNSLRPGILSTKNNEKIPPI